MVEEELWIHLWLTASEFAEVNPSELLLLNHSRASSLPGDATDNTAGSPGTAKVGAMPFSEKGSFPAGELTASSRECRGGRGGVTGARCTFWRKQYRVV